jgi:hypothetical protein
MSVSEIPGSDGGKGVDRGLLVADAVSSSETLGPHGVTTQKTMTDVHFTSVRIDSWEFFLWKRIVSWEVSAPPLPLKCL